MKNTFGVLAVLTMLIASSQNIFAVEANTNNGWYTRVGVGYAKQIDNYNETNYGISNFEFEGGPNLTISSGYDSKYWAAEGEFSYKKMDVDAYNITIGNGFTYDFEGDQSQIAIMLNGFWYPKPEWTIAPYMGAGLGMTKISWNGIKSSAGIGNAVDDSDTVFTYQLIIGASYKISSKLFLETDYRYFAPGDIDLNVSNGTSMKIDNQELNILAVAIKYKF